MSQPRSPAQRAVELAQAAVRHHQAGELPDAVRLYEQVSKLVTPSAAVLSNLGDAYRRLGRFEDANGAFRRALSQDARSAPAHFNLGLTLEQLGRHGEAADAFAAALALNASLPNVALLLLQALRDDQQFERGIAAYATFREQVPESAELQRAIGNLLVDVFRVDEGIAHFEHGLALAPDSAELHTDCAAALLERGQAADAVAALRQALALDPTLRAAHSNLVYLLPFVPGETAQSVLAEARRFDAAHASRVERRKSYANSRERTRRLRIGYVSPDFRSHPMASFLPEVLRHHDRAAVEVFCYSNVRRADAVTDTVRALSDVFRDVVAITDEEAAQQIAHDGIDVLIDLAMHSGGSRPLLFARKPAPIQACWLAYPGTTGIGAMDYRITDSVIDPPGTDADYSERSLRLPGCFWCYAPPPGAPRVSPLPALSAGHVTFGSPNSFKKVSDAALDLWARVLVSVPGSRMLIVTPTGLAWQRVERAFEARGVAAQRLERLPHAQRSSYLASIQRMDCVLDTTPYNGGTATFDALYLGVPCITLAGDTAAARSGASIAKHLGLDELVAASPEDYVSRAMHLVEDLTGLSALRATLRPRLEQSPLMDAPRFTRGLEALYRQMFEGWLAAEVET